MSQRVVVMFILQAIILGASLCVFAAQESDRIAWAKFEARCNQCRAYWCSLRMESAADGAAIIAKELNEYPAEGITSGDVGSDVFLYLHGRMEFFRGNASAGVTIMKKLVASRLVAPDTLTNLVSYYGRNGNHELYLKYQEYLGELLPFSHYADVTNRIITDVPVIGYYGDRPVFPIFHGNEALRIADLYFEMGMLHAAANAYTEYIYGEFALTGTFVVSKSNPQHASWSSSESAPYWLIVADLSWRDGDTARAAASLARAIIFGDEETAGKGVALLHKIKDSVMTKQQPANPSPKLIREIAQLYVRMNMHPRALQLLRENKEIVGGDSEDLVKRYKNDWMQKIQTFCSNVNSSNGRCILFGQDVLPIETKGMAISIPYQLETAPLQRISKQVNGLPN